MAQPIKKQTLNPWNFFSKELTTLISYITDEVAPVFGISEITPEVFVYAALDNNDCMLYKAINSFLNSSDILYIHDEIGKILIKSDGIIGGKVDFDRNMLMMFNVALEIMNNTNSKYITSDHVFLAILRNNDTQSRLKKLFKSVGVNYNTMLDLSKQVHDVISNDVVKIDDNNDCELHKEIDTQNGTIHIFGNAPEKLVQILQNLPEELNNIKQVTNNTKKTSKNIEFCTNLNAECEKGKIEDLIGRETELNAIYNVLGRKKCNNAILIGESGVGKTQCVLGIAKALHDGTTPLQFRNKEILKLNPGEILAGTSLRGQLEARMVDLVKQLKANPNAILFIDDIDTMFGSKNTSSDYDTGGILNELLRDGTTQIIATTSTKKYKSIVDNNPDIADKFQEIIIEKPSVNECINILCQSKKNYEKYHNVKYSEEIIYTAVNLCNRYITEKQLPASAFDVIDELGSYKKLNCLDNIMAKDVLKQIHDLEVVKDGYIKKDKMDDANDITNKINEFRDKLAKLQANINKRGAQTVTMDDLYHVVSEHTHIPVSKISSTEKEELKHISDTLKQVVVGQNEAIDIISRAIRRNKIGLSNSSRCRLSIMAIGPTGCGKTLIAKTLAKEIFGDEKYLVRFDMSEYADETSVNKLIGASAGYVGYTEGGLLTEAIKNKKYCVLLIDEIEKAHDKVYNLFLQILDEGFLTDNTGYKVDFRNTIIIMTSNVGAKKAANTKNIGFSPDNSQAKEDVLKKELKNKFPPEFLNRLDDIIFFNPLTDDNLKAIIKIELGYLQKRVEGIHYELKYTDDVVDVLFNVISDEKEYGARPIHRAIRDKIENKLTDMLIEEDYPLGKQFTVSVNEEKGLEIV